MTNPIKRPHEHRHGGAPLYDFDRLKLTPRRVVDFSVNISPLGVPEAVKDAWPRLISDIGNYPSTTGDGVRVFYQNKFGLPGECVLPGNGSIDLIYLAPGALGIKKAVVLCPSFYDYERALRAAQACVTRLTLSPDNNFAPPPLEQLTQSLEKVDAIILGHPNNPTSTCFKASDLLSIADKFPKKYIIIDEAFIQFVDDYQRRTMLNPDRIRKNILVFHSLTKFYSVPGLRLGSVISHPETISMLELHQAPWAVNSPAEQIAPVLLKCTDYEAKLHALIKAERTKFIDNLSNLKTIRLFGSSANFFLAKWQATPNLDDLLRPLLEAGLYIRDCRNFPGLKSGYFRFSIQRPEDNDRLITALKQASNV